MNSFNPFQGYYSTSPNYITHRSETVSHIPICICVQMQVRCADPTSYISEHSSKIQHRSTTQKIRVVLHSMIPLFYECFQIMAMQWGRLCYATCGHKILQRVACRSCAAVEWENHQILEKNEREWKGKEGEGG